MAKLDSAWRFVRHPRDTFQLATSGRAEDATEAQERELAAQFSRELGHHLSLAERSKRSREFDGSAVPLSISVHRGRV